MCEILRFSQYVLNARVTLNCAYILIHAICISGKQTFKTVTFFRSIIIYIKFANRIGFINLSVDTYLSRFKPRVVLKEGSYGTVLREAFAMLLT